MRLQHNRFATACLPVRCLRTILLQISNEANAEPGLGVAIARVAAVIWTSEKLAVCALEAFGTITAPPGICHAKKKDIFLIAGWWLIYPSEKYESQLGLYIIPNIWKVIKVMFQSPPTGH